MKHIITITSLILWSTIGFTQSFNSEKIDTLFSLLEDNNKFMGSVAISQNQNTIYNNSIGFIDIENGKKANNTSKYRIGSISKIFTASLVFKAIEDKKLELNQTINTFFPNIKNSNIITIENLLNHSSGIRDFTRNEEYTDWNTVFQSKEKMIKHIESGKSEFNPNEKSEYSNSNYVLLTFILEEIYNESFSKILNRNIIEPLQLKNTYYGSKINTAKNESYSYKYEGNWKKESETHMSIPQGAGAIISNPKDLNLFVEHLFLGKIISDESLKLMKTIKNGYGMGLFQFPYNNKVSYGHTGSIDGFQSVTTYFPEEKLTITLTSNAVNYDKNKILLAVLATYFNEEYHLPKFNQIELTTEDLEKYLGIYSSEEIPPKITITKKENTLFAQATGQGAFPLEPTTENEFTFDQAGVKIKFNPSEKTMILYQGGGEFHFKTE